jgi:hypothetical protein
MRGSTAKRTRATGGTGHRSLPELTGRSAQVAERDVLVYGTVTVFVISLYAYFLS